jgi:hypothetical protein
VRHWRLLGIAGTACVLLAALAGCGPGEQDEPSGPGAGAWGECDSAAFEEAGGQVAEVRTEQQDDPVVVKLVGGDGPCAGLVARYDTGIEGHGVEALDLDRDSASVVTLDGGQALLRVDSAGHPRGGYQPHLFAVVAGMAEVTADGAPLLPFVATDGGAAPTTARCGGPGTIEVLTARTSKPLGVVLAWDVWRTTYEVDGAKVKGAGNEQIRDHAADPLLRKAIPELFEPGGLLGNCDA